EAAALASLKSENVVQVYAFGLYEGGCYFVMELVNGPTLEALIAAYRERQTTVPLFRAVTVLTSIATGLAKVHATGVVHRDVKPANVVIEDD
ncbi:protein kinase domain-containing protein, partial [Klebsiella pneumoniae]|uniref:protein kinase domain-containing protein n=1 Tax=Klebsiella pneumoniae TaxID=573 RepID=UPI003EDEA7D3